MMAEIFDGRNKLGGLFKRGEYFVIVNAKNPYLSWDFVVLTDSRVIQEGEDKDKEIIDQVLTHRLSPDSKLIFDSTQKVEKGEPVLVEVIVDPTGKNEKRPAELVIVAREPKIIFFG